jgi:hypothetical protein
MRPSSEGPPLSRGPGRVQRAIMEYLASWDPPYRDRAFPPEIWLSDLAAAIFDTGRPTRSQLTSVSRAVGGLAAAEKISAVRKPRYDRRYAQSRRARKWFPGPAGAWRWYVATSETAVSRLPTPAEQMMQAQRASEDRKYRPPRRSLRREREELIDFAYREAEEAVGQAISTWAMAEAGITGRSLFTGTEARARKWASEELLRHWDDHPRPPSRAAYRRQAQMEWQRERGGRYLAMPPGELNPSPAAGPSGPSDSRSELFPEWDDDEGPWNWLFPNGADDGQVKPQHQAEPRPKPEPEPGEYELPFDF